MESSVQPHERPFQLLNTIEKLNELKEKKNFNEKNIKLVTKALEARVWEDWWFHSGSTTLKEEETIIKCFSVLKTWESCDVKELEKVHEAMSDLRLYEVPATAAGYSKLIQKLEAVLFWYEKKQKMARFRHCFRMLMMEQSRRRKCLIMLEEFGKKHNVFQDDE